jgi:phage-related holin
MLQETREIIMTTYSEFMQQLFDMWQVKGAMTLSFASIASFLGVESSMITWLNVVIGLDLIFGIIVAFKMRTYHPLRIEKTVRKVMAYYSSIFMMALVCNYTYSIFHTNWHIVEVYVLYLLSIECLSIMRHGEDLGLQYPPVARIFINGFSHKMEEKVEQLLDVDDSRDKGGHDRDTNRDTGRDIVGTRGDTMGTRGDKRGQD